MKLIRTLLIEWHWFWSVHYYRKERYERKFAANNFDGYEEWKAQQDMKKYREKRMHHYKRWVELRKHKATGI
jgi:hypothetical protein